MRILFLHEVNYLTKPIYEMHEFPEYLAARGHEVAFWHFPEGYSRKQIEELGFRKTLNGRAVLGARISIYTPQSWKGDLFGRLLTAITAGAIARSIIDDFRPDVIVSFAVPTQGWQTLRVAKDNHVPFVFRALDVSHRIRRGPFSRLIRVAEKFLYRNSDFVSANNQAMLDYCKNLAGKPLVRSDVHFPPIDLSAFRGGDRGVGRALLGLSESERIVMYMGSFFYFSGLTEVITSMIGKSKSFKLVLVGNGGQEEELRELVMNSGLQDRVIFSGFIPFDQLPHVLAAADVAINPMERTLVSNAALPNKVLQYLACRLPVVATKLDGLYATFGRSTLVKWVEGPSEVVPAAIELLESRFVQDVSKADLFLDSLGAQAVKAFEESLQEVSGRK